MMRITCPKCDYSSEVDPERVPENVATAICPRCNQRFDFKREDALPVVPIEPQSSPAEPTPATPAGPPRPALAADMAEGIPWENPERGLFRDFFKTIGLILFHPDTFFQRMPLRDGYVAPLAFGLITGSVGLVLSWYWPILLGATLWRTNPFQQFGMLSFLNRGGLVLLVIAAPFLVALTLGVMSVVIHVMLLLVLAGRGGFQATFRVLAYSQAASLFNVVPMLGGLVGGLWMLVLYVLGLSRAHDIGLFRAVLALLILPFLLTLLFVVAVVLLIGRLAF